MTNTINLDMKNSYQLETPFSWTLLFCIDNVSYKYRA
jgi:hypothetical protein